MHSCSAERVLALKCGLFSLKKRNPNQKPNRKHAKWQRQPLKESWEWLCGETYSNAVWKGAQPLVSMVSHQNVTDCPPILGTPVT